jgi:hypothetical protein
VNSTIFLCTPLWTVQGYPQPDDSPVELCSVSCATMAPMPSSQPSSQP